MSDSDMSRFEFNDIVKDVASFFGNPKGPQMDILYDIFKVYPYAQMKRACRFLIENHDHRFFPSPREIHDALREVAELKTPPPEDMPSDPEAYAASRCYDCGGAGMIVEDRQEGEYKHTVAIYCACAKGRKMKSGHQAYMKKNHNRGD